MSERLAIDGGTPVRGTLLSYGRQAIDEDDVQAVVTALRSDWLTTGPQVAKFERAVAVAVGAPHAVAVSSGTAALHAATFAAGIGPGDEVVVAALTFAASANAVLYQGGTPVFADVRRDTLCVDPADIEAKVTRQTRAVVAVDFAGQPAALDEIGAFTRDRRLLLIEDAAHALGAEYRGRRLGSLADLTTFSFHPVKHVTTGEGGVVTTPSDEMNARLRRFRNHGLESEFTRRDERGDEYSPMVDLGYNYRLTDVACALGLSQLAKLDQFLKRRAELAQRYRAELAAQPGLRLPDVAPDVRHAWHIFPVLLDVERLTVDRRTILAALRAENIGATVHYVPVYWHPYYRDRGYRRGLCPNAEWAFERLLTLPLFPAMSDEDVGPGPVRRAQGAGPLPAMSDTTASRIAFVTDGGSEIGLGHLSRCAALCRAAVAEGVRTTFLLPEPSRIKPFLRGVRAELLRSSWPVDADGARATLATLMPDVIVVDSYAASSHFLDSLRAIAPVVAVDDLADRPLPVDVVVNGGAGAETLSYDRRPGTHYLLGPRYALLHPAYAATPSRAATERVRRVLVCLGGGRQIDVSVTVLAAVDRALSGCVVDVVVGASGGTGWELDGAAREMQNLTVIHRDRFGLRELMLRADLAVSGAGVTLLELAATATPMVAIALVDNQRPNFEALTKAGVALGAGAAGDPDLSDAIEAGVKRLAGDGALRETLGARGRALVDGQGAHRVAELIGRPASSWQGADALSRHRHRIDRACATAAISSRSAMPCVAWDADPHVSRRSAACPVSRRSRQPRSRACREA